MSENNDDVQRAKAHETITEWQKKGRIDFVNRTHGLQSTTTISHDSLIELLLLYNDKINNG